MHINQFILDIIEQGTTEGRLYRLPAGQLDRKTYRAVNKVLVSLGGKWNRKSKAHIFEMDISDAIDDVLLTGEVLDKKKELQFFETPKNITDKLIELAGIQSGHSCLEPSAGHGNIAEALGAIVGKGKVACIDLDPGNVRVLSSKGFVVYEGDFLKYKTKFTYDHIVMNPPFTRQQDITHVLKALLHLEKGGVLVSVMSNGVLFRTNKKTQDFWAEIKKNVHKIIQLPEGSFRMSGTMVSAIILKVVLS